MLGVCVPDIVRVPEIDAVKEGDGETVGVRETLGDIDVDPDPTWVNV